MKAVFIVYGQTLTEPIATLLNKLNIRGYTQWNETYGCGSVKGEPHFGSHAWPTKNGSILTIIDDNDVEPLLAALRKLNERVEQQGLNAFVWNVEDRM